jgi:uncharacterized RDD family membrane protein YckC
VTVPIRAEYAGVVTRAIAFLTDAAVVAIFAYGTIAGIQLTVAVIGGDLRQLAPAAVTVLVTALPLLLVSYDVVFWGLTGRTPGMALLGVRVTMSAGRPVTWTASLIRAVVLSYFPIGSLWCLVDRRRQAVHDKLARTVVVRAMPATTHTDRS